VRLEERSVCVIEIGYTGEDAEQRAATCCIDGGVVCVDGGQTTMALAAVYASHSTQVKSLMSTAITRQQAFGFEHAVGSSCEACMAWALAPHSLTRHACSLASVLHADELHHQQHHGTPRVAAKQVHATRRRSVRALLGPMLPGAASTDASGVFDALLVRLLACAPARLAPSWRRNDTRRRCIW
jgi:hypothetical protein